MNRRLVISAYTPSNTDRELLKRIFVQRERLLDKIVDRLARSMLTDDKHHILLIGPRGSGKTHLVALVEYELRRRGELSDAMRVAWLGEDDTFTGLIDIALGIAGQLATEYPEEFDADYRTPVRGLNPDDAAESILKSIIARLDKRNILLIMENLDRVFSGLGDLGQKKWRAFLQEQPRIATLATSQQLFDGIARRDEAFFGFFDIQHLTPLSVDDARELIRKISLEQKKGDLVAYLDSAEGRYRIRALHHLAGGNHRMYVLLAEFLTKESLDDLVHAFEHLAEDLTPYFQERVRTLPPQQARIVQCLCNANGAMTVKEVAEDSFIAEGNCSKQLGNLKQRGYVQSQKRGKESFYEMAEPLMRLCLEVKNQRGRPLKLVAKFLRAWFPESQLQKTLNPASGASSRGDAYRAAALETDAGIEKFLKVNLNAEIRKCVSNRQFDKALELSSELNFVAPLSASLVRGEVLARSGSYEECAEELSKIIDMAEAPAEQKAKALINRGLTYSQRGDTERALADYTAVLDMAEAPAEQKAQALFNRGVTYRQRGDTERALADYTAVLDMAEAPAGQKAQALFDRGLTYRQRGDTERALADYTAVLDMAEAPAESKAQALFNRGVTQWQLGQFGPAQQSFEQLLDIPELPPQQMTAALFALPEAMIAGASREQVIAALESAFRTGDSAAECYGGTPGDLLAMVLRRGHQEWDGYIAALVPLYVNNKAAAKLGQGVTHTIELLATEGYSESQLDTWNRAWQRAGQGCEELEIPLQSLDAAVEAIKTRSDRPLFRLPLEVREIVRPLVAKSLSE